MRKDCTAFVGRRMGSQTIKGRPDNITQLRQNDDVAYHTLLSSTRSVRLNGDKTYTTSGANENN